MLVNWKGSHSACSQLSTRNYPPYILRLKKKAQACLHYTNEIRQGGDFTAYHCGRFPLKEEFEAIAGVSSMYDWVAGSVTLGSLWTLPFPFLAFGPISSIMYFQPSIGRLRLKMWVLMKLAICNHNFNVIIETIVRNSIG